MAVVKSVEAFSPANLFTSVGMTDRIPATYVLPMPKGRMDGTLAMLTTRVEKADPNSPRLSQKTSKNEALAK